MMAVLVGSQVANPFAVLGALCRGRVRGAEGERTPGDV